MTWHKFTIIFPLIYFPYWYLWKGIGRSHLRGENAVCRKVWQLQKLLLNLHFTGCELTGTVFVSLVRLDDDRRMVIRCLNKAMFDAFDYLNNKPRPIPKSIKWNLYTQRVLFPNIYFLIVIQGTHIYTLQARIQDSEGGGGGSYRNLG